jgi:hypothetical protein
LARLNFFCYFSDNVPAAANNSVYEFGPFRLEWQEHRLMRAGQPIPLTGRLSARCARWSSGTANWFQSET